MEPGGQQGRRGDRTGAIRRRGRPDESRAPALRRRAPAIRSRLRARAINAGRVRSQATPCAPVGTGPNRGNLSVAGDWGYPDPGTRKADSAPGSTSRRRNPAFAGSTASIRAASSRVASRRRSVQPVSRPAGTACPSSARGSTATASRRLPKSTDTGRQRPWAMCSVSAVTPSCCSRTSTCDESVPSPSSRMRT